MQREACAGDVMRLQKAKRHGDKLLSRLTKENNRFLDLRDRIIPSLNKEIEGYKDFIEVLIDIFLLSLAARRLSIFS